MTLIICKCGLRFVTPEGADEHWEQAHAWEDQVGL